MDAHLIFWLYAYVLMFVVLVVGYRGVRLIKAGDTRGHMRAMVLACNLLLFFVVSYLVKVVALGREDKSAWQAWQLVVLYVHESMILLMLVTGTRARLLARRFAAALKADGDMAGVDPALRATHARWGKAALGFACAAFLTATGVMYTLFSLRG